MGRQADSVLVDEPLLDALEQQWRVQDLPVVGRLRPGLSEQAQNALVEPVGIHLPIEARRWWGWHDGANPGGLAIEREIGPGFPFLTLEEAVDAYRRYREAAAESDEPDYWWRPSWFPITDRRGAVRCDCDVASGEPAPIYWAYSHDHDRDGLTRPRARSFGEVVTWWIDALQRRLWEFDRDSRGWAYH